MFLLRSDLSYVRMNDQHTKCVYQQCQFSTVVPSTRITCYYQIWNFFHVTSDALKSRTASGDYLI